MKNRRSPRGVSLASAVALVTITAMIAGPTVAQAGTSVAATAKSTLPGTSKLINISQVNLGAGARSVGLEAGHIFMQSTKEGTVNVTLSNPDPYVRIVPVTGNPYYISAGTLNQYFSALLGPAPTIGVSYGTKDRTRSLTLTQGVTAPIYDIANQAMTFQAIGSMDVVSSDKALITFIATDPTWRQGRTPGSKSIEVRNHKLRDSGQADTNQTFAYDAATFLSPTNPPTMLSATQQIFSGNNCVTYSGTPTTGGQIIGVSNLTVQSTSSDVSQSVSAGTSASVKYGGLKTSMSASYTGSKSQDSASLYAVGTVSEAGIATTLKPTLVYDASVITDLNSAVQLIGACGDMVSTGYTSGALYQAVLQMETASQSEAQQLKASMSASYSTPGSSTSGSASFAGAVSADSSVQNVQVTEMCVGPSSCQAVAGYAPIDETSTTTALNSFSNNYAAMQKGLGSICQSPSQAANCVVNMQYAPIENIISGSLANASTAKSLVSQASNGVYWLINNTQTWANEYQSLSTAYYNAATYQDSNVAQYTLTSDQLRTQAGSYASTATNLLQWAGKTCAGSQMGGTNCLTPMVNCSSVVLTSGTNAPACLPSSLSTFSGLADPSTLAAPTLQQSPSDCNTAVSDHRSSDNQQTTLYLGGIQAVSYPVWCVWLDNAVTTYLQLPSAATSQTDTGTTTFNYVQFDPSTGAIYPMPASYPSNAPTQVMPSCTTAPCAPFGYAMSYNSSASHNFVATLPSNLAFASTTTLVGAGKWQITTPSTRGIPSNKWAVTEPSGGGAQLTDSSVGSAGVVLAVPASSNYKWTAPTAGQIVQSSQSASSACATSSSGKTSSNGDASNNSTNQELQGVGYINGNTGACEAQLYEYNWKNNGASAWTDKSWYVNSQWGALEPTYICGSRTSLNGQLTYYYDPSNPKSLQVQWYASNYSKDDPYMYVWVGYDNVNQPIAGTNGGWSYVKGDCTNYDHNLQAGVSPL